MSDRIVGLLFLGLSIWYGYTAGSYEASFGDPLGPAAFPQIISVPAALVSLGLILRPDPDPTWSRGVVALRQIGALVLFVAYAVLLIPLGFGLSTFLGVMLFAMLIGASWLKGALAGIIMAPALFILFDVLLGLPLPLAPSL
ncbi:tripartite tricarboxylate transporter TctB family protein [Acuticoccus mangrovi]|uniref:Tripartite tricarboxylate transporter TctB family protein n=1 Tax=Acuticoccus mangrovi TaxID=2796142 RepID=A0A934MND7_9HYPH|nr:tripartite tricarboxylate transporter TctB family protein [Acuticoccus mangrovi]MBJ3778094.1 tripartite tricarboxylate transporter TctB family protein [Acuticoccus mangrovi]